MSTEKLKDQTGKMIRFCKKHKQEIEFGMRVLQDEILVEQIREAFVEKGHDTYEEKALYEQALDYASK